MSLWLVGVGWQAFGREGVFFPLAEQFKTVADCCNQIGGLGWLREAEKEGVKEQE